MSSSSADNSLPKDNGILTVNTEVEKGRISQASRESQPAETRLGNFYKGPAPVSPSQDVFDPFSSIFKRRESVSRNKDSATHSKRTSLNQKPAVNNTDDTLAVDEVHPERKPSFQNDLEHRLQSLMLHRTSFSHSKEIDKQIQAENKIHQKQYKNALKCLLLGSGDSGISN